MSVTCSSVAFDLTLFSEKGIVMNGALQWIGSSGALPDTTQIHLAQTYFESRGWRVLGVDVAHRRHLRFAGTDKQRLNEINSLGEPVDGHVPDVVLGVRGGYGLIRLLDQIAWRPLAERLLQHRIMLVGQSDMTALSLGLYALAGFASFSGPMVYGDFNRAPVDPITAVSFWQAVGHRRGMVEVADGTQPRVSTEGIMWGGNLCTLCSLVGTPYMPQVEHGILFLEDVNEHPYRVERMLLQLWHAGLLQRQAAIVLGDFTDYKLVPHDHGYDIAEVVRLMRERLSVPLLTGLPYGHGSSKYTLPIGLPGRLDSDATGWSLTWSSADYPPSDTDTQNRGFPCRS